MTEKEYHARLVDLNRRTGELVETLKNHTRYQWLEDASMILVVAALAAVLLLR